MNRPQKVRAIYQELKSTLGSEIPAQDLLEAASAMVNIHDWVTDTSPRASIAENDRSFESMEMNFAMSDGGWRVMNREKELMRNFYMQYDDEYEDPLDFLDSMNSSAA